jgi:hypothetical protein
MAVAGAAHAAAAHGQAPYVGRPRRTADATIARLTIAAADSSRRERTSVEADAAEVSTTAFKLAAPYFSARSATSSLAIGILIEVDRPQLALVAGSGSGCAPLRANRSIRPSPERRLLAAGKL